MKTPKQKPLTPDDLKSLVQALGALVRESVREEITVAVRPLVRAVEELKESPGSTDTPDAPVDSETIRLAINETKPHDA